MTKGLRNEADQSRVCWLKWWRVALRFPTWQPRAQRTGRTGLHNATHKSQSPEARLQRFFQVLSMYSLLW